MALALLCAAVLAQWTYADLGPHLDGRPFHEKAGLGLGVGLVSALPMLVLLTAARRPLKRLTWFYAFTITVYHVVTPLPPGRGGSSGHEQALWRQEGGWYIAFSIAGYLLGCFAVLLLALRTAAPQDSSTHHEPRGRRRR